MNIEQIEQQCAETLLDYAITMANAYVTEPPTKIPVTLRMITASVLRAMSNHIISLSLEGKLLPK